MRYWNDFSITTGRYMESFSNLTFFECMDHCNEKDNCLAVRYIKSFEINRAPTCTLYQGSKIWSYQAVNNFAEYTSALKQHYTGENIPAKAHDGLSTDTPIENLIPGTRQKFCHLTLKKLLKTLRY